MRYRGLTRALVATACVLLLLLTVWGPAGPSSATAAELPRNIIIMFADGAASTQWDFGRYSSQVLRQQPFATTDVVFRQGVVGLLATSPSNAYVTDSAAAASAMSIGAKVKNGAISITPDGTSPHTVMEAAKAAGKRIGLVTTAAVYDATPAAFALHAASRRDSQALVDQLLVLEPDVLMGGGADHFLPAGTPGGKRKDGRDVIAAFRARGYAVARTPAALAAASGAKLLALFSEDDMEYEIERDPAREPTTAEMAVAALKALGQPSPNGFVLLVENENIDTAGHRNDAASLMRALWAFDDAVKVALEFQRRHPDTLVIVTGDHETGGFSPTYATKDLSGGGRFYSGDEHVKMLERITVSLDTVKDRLGQPPSGEALDRLLARHFPGFRLDPDLRAQILGGKVDERNFSYPIQNALGRMVARQTGYYWGTSGHTPQPVLVGAIGPGAAGFHGYRDNTDFGKHLHRLIRGK